MGKSKKRAASEVCAGDETKRPAVEEDIEEEEEDSEDSDDVDVSEEEEEDEDDKDAFKEVNVDFEFFDPKEIDFHGLKALLGTYIDGGSLDTSELADTIIAQATVGTILKTAEDEDPIGLVSVLNLKRYQKLESLVQVKRFLLSKAKDQAMKDNIDKAWKADGTGLLLTERLINVPPQIAPPLMQAIFDEIEWATEDEPTQELRDSYKFNQYLIVTRVYVDPVSASGGASSSKSHSKKPKVDGAEPLLVYVRPEDEAFHQLCTWSFSFRTEKEVGKDELQPWRLAMLVPATAVPAVQERVAAAVATAT